MTTLIQFSLDTLTPLQAKAIGAMLAIISGDQAPLVKAPNAREKTTEIVCPITVPEITIEVEEVPATQAEEPVHAAVEVEVEAPKSRRGRPRKEEKAPTVEPIPEIIDVVFPTETPQETAEVPETPQETAEAPETPTAQAKTEPPTVDELRAALGHVQQKKGMAEVISLLKRYECQRISDLAKRPAADQHEFVRLAHA